MSVFHCAACEMPHDSDVTDMVVVNDEEYCVHNAPAPYGFPSAFRVTEALRLAQLADAAASWWVALRPAGWTEAQHRSDYAINTRTVIENDLAVAVVRYRQALEAA